MKALAGRLLDADLGDGPRQHDLRDPVRVQHVLQVRVVKAAPYLSITGSPIPGLSSSITAWPSSASARSP